MHYSNGLEYIIGSSYTGTSYSNVSKINNSISFETQYTKKASAIHYNPQQRYPTNYIAEHSFTPEIFLNPSRLKARFIDDNDEARRIAGGIFEIMVNEKMPSNISINILPFDEFKALHSCFGPWSNGILGFSLNGAEKKIFVRENHLDSLMLVIGHEIGHVLTETLPNKHDEEAKAFAFSIGWAKTIKEHNIAGLGLSIKDDIDFLQPARNGLHDVAFCFVDFMVKKGRKAIELHRDLINRYVSVFNRVY